jgi:hypothetical protein
MREETKKGTLVGHMLARNLGVEVNSMWRDELIPRQMMVTVRETKEKTGDGFAPDTFYHVELEDSQMNVVACECEPKPPMYPVVVDYQPA